MPWPRAPSFALKQPALDVQPGKTDEHWRPAAPAWECVGAQCDLDLDEPQLTGSFLEAAKALKNVLHTRPWCRQVAYTVNLGREEFLESFAPPQGSDGCAFAFVNNGSVLFTRSPTTGERVQSPPQWYLISVPAGNMPWPVEHIRRNQRVPKILPHLFFPTSVEATVYMDSENPVAAKLDEVVQTTLTDCNASFAVQASARAAIHVMQEFAAIRRRDHAHGTSALDAQEQAYRDDSAYQEAVDRGYGIGINGELLVRRMTHETRLLDTAWMRAYLRGADIDRPSFSYAYARTVTVPCLADPVPCRHRMCFVGVNRYHPTQPACP